MKFERIFKFVAPCLFLPALIQAGEAHDPAPRQGTTLSFHTAYTKFSSALGISPSAGFGVSVSLPIMDFALGLTLQRTSSEIPYDVIGGSSAVPVAVTSGMFQARHPLWSPGAAFSVLAEAGAGIVVFTTSPHVISLGAVGERTLRGHNDVHTIAGVSLPLQVHPLNRLIVEVSPSLSWMFGPSGPFTTYSLTGGLGLVIH